MKSFSSNSIKKLIIAFSYMGTAIAILIARRSPATQHEISIYSSTPFLFWPLIIFSILISIYLSIYHIDDIYGMLGIILGGISMTSIVSLPLVRGYYYVGRGDSLSHLGVTLDVLAENIQLLDVAYPIIYSLGINLSLILNYNVPKGLLLLIYLYVVVYFTFIPLVVRSLSSNKRIATVGLFSGFLLLPITHLATHMQVHPTSQAIMYSPVIFYISNKYFKTGSRKTLLLFVVISIYFILLHPQQGLNFLIFIGFIALFELMNIREMHFIEPIRLTNLALIFIVIWWIWIQNLNKFESSLQGLIIKIMTFSLTPAAKTQGRAMSLEGVGGNLLEVFIKMFGPSLLLSGFALLLMALSIQYYFKREMFMQQSIFRIARNKYILLYTLGFIPLILMFLIYLGMGISEQYFRHFGFIMVVVTVLGAISVWLVSNLFDEMNILSANKFIFIMLSLLIIMTIPIVFNSPYFYQTTPITTEGELNGYDTLFNIKNESMPIIPLRGDTERIEHAIYGRYTQPDIMWERSEYGLPDHFANQSLSTYYDKKVYATIKSDSKVREVQVWNEFRYTSDDFEYLHRSSNIQKVHSNGHLYVYLVVPE